MRVERHAVGERGHRDLAHVVGRHEVLAVDERQRLRQALQRERGARARPQADGAASARRSHDGDDVAAHVVGDPHLGHRMAHRDDFRERGHGLKRVQRMLALLRGEHLDFLLGLDVAEAEAQREAIELRFGLGYVKPEQEVEMLAAQKGEHPLHALQPVATLAEVVAMCHAVTEVRISDDVRRYIVSIVGATRGRGAIRLGASPRASLALQRLSQALALIDGEEFVTPDHVREIAVPALAHRVTLDSHARFSGASSEQIVAETMRAVALPA